MRISQKKGLDNLFALTQCEAWRVRPHPRVSSQYVFSLSS